MYFKITDGQIENSREPIEGGFEQNGLEYDFDAGRLVVVSDTEVRDMTKEELFDRDKASLFDAVFHAAEAYIFATLTPYGYGYTTRKAAEGSTEAIANLAWCDSVFALHDAKVATITADSFMSLDMDEVTDYSSLGDKPHKISEY